MNLKESFRYQTFLETNLENACESIMRADHCLTTTELHKRSQSNADAKDVEKVIESETRFYPNDDVIDFILWLLDERHKLSCAIDTAKSTIDFDIDAALDLNRSTRSVCSALKHMLEFKPSTKIIQGRDYTFNVAGDQTPYMYDIEVKREEAFDRTKGKNTMQNLISEADKTSMRIDMALLSTQVDYEPVYDVNESFDDIMEDFVSKKQNQEA